MKLYVPKGDYVATWHFSHEDLLVPYTSYKCYSDFYEDLFKVLTILEKYKMLIPKFISRGQIEPLTIISTDAPATQNLANKLGGNRKVIAWEGEVKVFENGRIEGAGAYKEYRAGQDAQNTLSPVGSGAGASGSFVRLGGFDGFLSSNGLNILKNKIKSFDNKLNLIS